MNRRVLLTKFGGPEVLQVESVADMPVPAAGEVRVRVEAATVGATDTVIRKGLYPVTRVRPPAVIGYDLVGVVDAVGPQVDAQWIGRRVSAMPQIGAAADLVCLPVSAVTEIPASAGAAEAAALTVSGITAYQMLHRHARVEAGDTILVHGGAGGVGHLLVQLAVATGARVVTTASGAALSVVREFGAVAIDYRAADLAVQLQRAAPDGYAAVFDPLGLASARRSYQLLRPFRSTLMVYATMLSARRITQRTPVSFLRFGTEFGMLMVHLAWWRSRADPDGKTARFYGVVDHHRGRRDWYDEDLAALHALMASGRLRPHVHRRALESAAAAHTMLEQGRIVGIQVLETSRI